MNYLNPLMLFDLIREQFGRLGVWLDDRFTQRRRPGSATPAAYSPRASSRFSVDEDDYRLLHAAIPVFFVVAFVLGAIYAERIAPMSHLLSSPALMAERRQERSQYYNVLVQQEYRPEVESAQRRAYSDVSAQGTGGITIAKGFHTLANDDTLERGGGAGGPGAARSQPTNTTRPQPQSREDDPTYEGPGETPPDSRPNPQRQPDPKPAAQAAGGGQRTRIPTNYRFRQDFALRYDGQDLFSIAREELVGYTYFRRMMRQIRESFPLLGNWSYRDPYGVVVNEQVKPQVVRVQFLIDPDGRVLDVRIVSSIGQRTVDEACLNTLRNQNFGPPPQEVIDTYGNIFGINFLFPPHRL